MGLTRPTLLSVPSFDATKAFTFQFAVQAGSAQITANKLTIRKQTDNLIVYEEKQETFRYDHVVAAGKLSNNEYYNATLTVFDASGAESPASIPIQFKCYSEPVLSFTNLPVGHLINNASFKFQFSYTQTENEPILKYVVNLYNAFQSLVSTSGEVYVADGAPPYIGEYLFAGFDDNTTYYVEVVGSTINGAVVSTERVQITVKYTRPDFFTLIELKNNCDEGYITLKSNIALIEGESNPDPPVYIDDKEVDLTAPDSWAEWNKGYKIDGDFLARIWFRKPNPYSEIVRFSNTQGQTIIIHYRLGYQDPNSPELKCYVDMAVQSIDGMIYYVFSNYIDLLADDKYYNLWVTREDNIYHLQFVAV